MSEVPYVNVTVYDIPSELFKEFADKVVKPYYLEGISQAIKDLMRKTVKEQKEKRKGHPEFTARVDREKKVWILRR